MAEVQKEQASGWKVTLDEDQVSVLLALGGIVTLLEDGVQNLEDAQLEDDEVDAFRLLPPIYRTKVTARLIELSESLRESLRELDGRILQLTAGQPAA